MADELHHPHDMMVRAVLSDLAEARSFLQTHLPQEVSQTLRWSTLTLLESSAVEVLLPHLGPEFSGAAGAARIASDCAVGIVPGRAELVVLQRVRRFVC